MTGLISIFHVVPFTFPFYNMGFLLTQVKAISRSCSFTWWDLKDYPFLYFLINTTQQ